MDAYLQTFFHTIMKVFLKGRNSEKGQDLAEYALLLGLIALIVIAAVILLGTNISEVFSSLASGLPF